MKIDQSLSQFAELPQLYDGGFSFEKTHIPFNGEGWDPSTGNTEACVSLFVKNPNCLILDVVPADVARVSTVDYQCIQAKIGLEYLRRENITSTARGIRITFRGPQEKQYQTGFQLVSLAMMSPNDLTTRNSNIRLLKVSWQKENNITRAP